jgi:hypothetical protein
MYLNFINTLLKVIDFDVEVFFLIFIVILVCMLLSGTLQVFFNIAENKLIKLKATHLTSK